MHPDPYLTNLSSTRKGLMFFTVCFMILILTCACSGGNQNSNSGTPLAVNFSQDVAPILNQRCIQCHSGDQASAQLDLSTFSGVIAGSANGTVITPGDAGNSKLVLLIRSGQMPRSGAKLTPDQVTIIENWVNSGAMDK